MRIFDNTTEAYPEILRDIVKFGRTAFSKTVQNLKDVSPEEYSMKELNLHRIEASALTENEGSKKVLLKNGFKVLGVNENYLFIDGKWRNHVTFYKILDK